MPKYCTSPFWTMEVDIEGNVTCCCPDWTNNYFFGNVFEQTYEEIWNGEKIREFRKLILNNQYPHCKIDMCSGIDERVFRDPNIDKDFIAAEYTPPPRFVTLSVEKSCNCKCIMCRSERTKLSDAETNRLISIMNKVFIPMIKNAEIVDINGAGELFYSEFYKQFIKKSIKTNPQIKFDILTNGLLCNKKKVNEYSLNGKMHVVTVSLHAATKLTYDKIVKYSNFNQVLKNVEYLSQLKKDNEIEDLALTFVLSSLNYKELPEFVELANNYGAFANIWPMRVNFASLEQFDIININHPKHKNLIDVLHKCNFDLPHIRANREILNLINN